MSGADLPFLKSEKENQCGKPDGEKWRTMAWMEATGNNDFKWIDGAFSAWNTGEPNNSAVENCAYM